MDLKFQFCVLITSLLFVSGVAHGAVSKIKTSAKADPASNIMVKPIANNGMPPIAMMQMQQQQSIEYRIAKKREFITLTENEIERLSQELQKETNYSSQKLKDSMKRSKKNHEKNLIQARIDLRLLEQQQNFISGSKKNIAKTNKNNFFRK